MRIEVLHGFNIRIASMRSKKGRIKITKVEIEKTMIIQDTNEINPVVEKFDPTKYEQS